MCVLLFSVCIVVEYFSPLFIVFSLSIYPLRHTMHTPIIFEILQISLKFLLIFDKGFLVLLNSF